MEPLKNSDEFLPQLDFGDNFSESAEEDSAAYKDCEAEVSQNIQKHPTTYQENENDDDCQAHVKTFRSSTYIDDYMYENVSEKKRTYAKLNSPYKSIDEKPVDELQTPYDCGKIYEFSEYAAKFPYSTAEKELRGSNFEDYYGRSNNVGLMDPSGNEENLWEHLCGKQQLPLAPRPSPQSIPDPVFPGRFMEFKNIAEVLRYRWQSCDRMISTIVLDNKGKEALNVTWDIIASRAEKLAQVICDKSDLLRGDRVALVYRESEIVEFTVSLFGCFVAGLIAVPINKFGAFSELNLILRKTQTRLALTTDTNLKAFQREFSTQKISWPKGIEWWKTNDLGLFYPKKGQSLPKMDPPQLAYIEYSRSPTGELRGVVISHKTIMHQMASLTASLLSSPGKHHLDPPRDYLRKEKMYRMPMIFMTFLDPRQAIGLISSVLLSVYMANRVIWCSQATISQPGLLAHILTRYRVNILLAEYPSLKVVAFNYQNDPKTTLGYSRKYQVDLSSLKRVLIDCSTVDSEFHEILADRWLKPLGHHRPWEILTPMLCLTEYGGMVVSMNDWLDPPASTSAYSTTLKTGNYKPLNELLLDNEALKTNEVVILFEGEEASKRQADLDCVLVGSSGRAFLETTLAIVDPETHLLCLPNIVGEIWVDSPSLSGGFFNSPKNTEMIFHAIPFMLDSQIKAVSQLDQDFLRTGLLGFIYKNDVYVLGLYEDRLRQKVEWVEGTAQEHIEYRYHYTSHLVQTVIRTVPRIFDCGAFDILVNEEYLPVIVLETPLALFCKENTSNGAEILNDEMLASLASLAEKCIECLLERHMLRVFCVLITAPNILPRISKNGRPQIGNLLTRRAFENGTIPCAYVRYGVERAVQNLPIGADPTGDVWSPVSVEIRERILQYEEKQISSTPAIQYFEDIRTKKDIRNFCSIYDFFKLRIQSQPDKMAMCTIDSKGRECKIVSWKKMETKISNVMNYLRNRHRFKVGDTVILMYTQSEEYIFVVYACFLLGLTIIPIPPLDPTRLPEDVPAFLSLLNDFEIEAVLVNIEVSSLMKSKSVAHHLKQSFLAANIAFPAIINTSKAPKQLRSYIDANLNLPKECLSSNFPAYVAVYLSPDMKRTAFQYSHQALLAACKTAFVDYEISCTTPVLATVRHCQGIGFLSTCLLGAFLGVEVYILSPFDFLNNPNLFFLALSRYKISSSYATPSSINYAMKKANPKAINLSYLQNLLIISDGRLSENFSRRLQLWLNSLNAAISCFSAVYSHAINPIVTRRFSSDPFEIIMDRRALRRGLIEIFDPSDQLAINYGLVLHSTGIPVTGSEIAIVNPETCRLCKFGEFGEIWIASSCSGQKYSKSTDPLDDARVNCTIDGCDPQKKFVRSGDLGFLHPVTPVHGQHNGTFLNCLILLANIGDTFEVNGVTYFPVDIETSIETCHKNIANGRSAVFKAGKAVIAVVEATLGTDSEFLAPLAFLMVNAVLEHHQLVLDTICFLFPNSFPLSRLGEKQRAKVLASWFTQKLNPMKTINVRNAPDKRLTFP